MTTFADTHTAITRARLDPTLRSMVEQIVESRYAIEADALEAMLWLLATSAMCVGGRVTLAELGRADA